MGNHLHPPDSPTDKLPRQLHQILSRRSCIVGLGNVDQGDDAFGVRLASRLAEVTPPHVQVVLAGTAPEWHLEQLAGGRFDHVLFLDAVDFDGPAGSVVLLDADEMRGRYPQISTHRLSLGLLAQCIERGGRTRAWLLGVQPESLRSGHGLSTPVQKTLDVFYALVVKTLAGTHSTASHNYGSRVHDKGRDKVFCQTETLPVFACFACFAGLIFVPLLC